jgi:hypothetical protein
MKLTPNAAMRARDVSRPRAEHLAEAEAAEASIAAGSRARTGEAAGSRARTGEAAGSRARTGEAANQAREDAVKTPRPPAAAGDERAGRPRFPRRRRGRAPR